MSRIEAETYEIRTDKELHQAYEDSFASVEKFLKASSFGNALLEVWKDELSREFILNESYGRFDFGHSERVIAEGIALLQDASPKGRHAVRRAINQIYHLFNIFLTNVVKKYFYSRSEPILTAGFYPRSPTADYFHLKFSTSDKHYHQVLFESLLSASWTQDSGAPAKPTPSSVAEECHTGVESVIK